MVVTIDGPAGAGKSSVGRALAERLGYLYVDTGAMYRAVAVLALEGEGDPLNEDLLERICEGLDLQIVRRDGEYRLFANGRDLSVEIRRPEVSTLASAVSARAGVRRRLSYLQRRLGERGGIVLEGRDMGTVVFPDADVKFFLDATPEVRSRRRYHELKAKGERVDLEEVYQDLIQRDRNDRSRQLSPLKPAREAIIVDSTELGINEVVEIMIKHLGSRTPENA